MNVNKVLCLAHRAQIQNRRWTVIVDVFVCVYLYLCICVFVCLYLCICICVFVIADKVVCRAHNRAQIENSSDYSRNCTTTGIVRDFSREPCYDVTYAAMCICMCVFVFVFLCVCIYAFVFVWFVFVFVWFLARALLRRTYAAMRIVIVVID